MSKFCGIYEDLFFMPAETISRSSLKSKRKTASFFPLSWNELLKAAMRAMGYLPVFWARTRQIRYLYCSLLHVANKLREKNRQKEMYRLFNLSRPPFSSFAAILNQSPLLTCHQHHHQQQSSSKIPIVDQTINHTCHQQFYENSAAAVNI